MKKEGIHPQVLGLAQMVEGHFLQHNIFSLTRSSVAKRLSKLSANKQERVNRTAARVNKEVLTDKAAMKTWFEGYMMRLHLAGEEGTAGQVWELLCALHGQPSTVQELKIGRASLPPGTSFSRN